MHKLKQVKYFFLILTKTSRACSEVIPNYIGAGACPGVKTYKGPFRGFITFSLILLFSFSALGDPIFTAKVDKTDITLEDDIFLTITASGGKPSEPDIPYTDDFKIHFQGSTSEVKIINGDISSSESFTYILRPQKTGTVTIPPVTASIDGKVMVTQPIKINVKNSQTKNTENGNEAFITAHVSNTEPYVNEQVIYTFRFFRKVQTTNQQFSFPKFDGFWVEELGKEKEYDRIINGERYVVTEVRKALFPAKAGKNEIKPAVMSADIIYVIEDPWSFNGIFSQTTTKNQKFTTNPLKITVRPLPSGKPAGFDNIVGSRLALKSEISHKQVKAGDSVTFTINIKGEGNINDIKAPKLNLPENIKVYDDKPVVSINTSDDKIVMEKTFKYALIPLQGGNLDVPEIRIPYFNVNTKKYETLSSGSYTVSVTPTGEQQVYQPSAVPEQKNVTRTVITDILGLHTGPVILKNQGLTPLRMITALFLLLLPPLLLLGLKLKEKSTAGFGRKVGLASGKVFRVTLDKINNLEKKVSGNGDSFSTEISSILKDYLENKYQLEKNMNNEEVSNRLYEKNLSGELVKEIRLMFEKYDFIRFSGKNISAENKKELLKATRELLSRVETKK